MVTWYKREANHRSQVSRQVVADCSCDSHIIKSHIDFVPFQTPVCKRKNERTAEPKFEGGLSGVERGVWNCKVRSYHCGV